MFSWAMALAVVVCLWACTGAGTGTSQGVSQVVPTITLDGVAPEANPQEDLLTKRLEGSITLQCVNSSNNILLIHLSGKLQAKQENGMWTDCCKNRLLRIIMDRDEGVDHYLDVVIDNQAQITAVPLHTLNYFPLGFYLMRKGFSPPEKVGQAHSCELYGCFTTEEDTPVKGELNTPENVQAPECPTWNGQSIPNVVF